MKIRAISMALLTVSAIVVILGFHATAPVTQAASPQSLTLDVACDSRTYRINQANPAATQILRGDTFVIDGNVYAGGSIPTGGTKESPSSFGPDQAGSIGYWFCKGTYIVDKSQFATAKMHTETMHIFMLNDKSRYITEGFEGPAQVIRSLIGGFNANPGISGQTTQQFLGVNSTGGNNLRFTFTLS